MEELIGLLVQGLSLPLLFAIIAVTIYTLAKGADILVDQAVIISTHWGVPKVLIGATIVSLGTTLPEAAVSVLASLQGKPGLALGNAVGSIICDTGLVLGTATLISPLPLDKAIVNRQGWLQLAAGFLLVVSCTPFSSLGKAFTEGGNLPQIVGFVFLLLLVVYIWKSIRWVKIQDSESELETKENHLDPSGTFPTAFKLIFGIVLVVASSWVLIPTVHETALRLRIPESIIAATLVAFGTSLPELITAVTAARKGHGEIAVGNVIGADILNVLFVAGTSAAVTKGGLDAPVQFFQLLFPAMLFILIAFRIGIFCSGDQLKRPFGIILLGIYLLVTVLGYTR